jgi:hypothetical protein
MKAHMSSETGGTGVDPSRQVPPREESPLRPPRGDKRLYFVLMAICIGLFVLSWAVVDRYSTVAAVIMTIVALIIPPFAAIVANAFSAADRRRR